MSFDSAELFYDIIELMTTVIWNPNKNIIEQVTE